MKASKLSKTKYDEDSGKQTSNLTSKNTDNEESDEEVDVDPVLEHRTITHKGGINRVKAKTLLFQITS